MAWPTTFANLTAGNQPLSLFDTMFNQVAQMVAIPCTPSGVNSITLSPIGSAPAIAGYQNFSSFRFVAASTTTAAVSAQFLALANLPVFLGDGVTQAGNGTITATQEYVLVFIQALNGGSGGFIVESAAIPAVQPVAGASFTNLVAQNNGGTPNTQIDVSYDALVMNNPTGGALRATAQSFTVNAAVNGVVNGLDTGALVATTWYALWGVSNGGTSGGLLSTSFTSPLMPATYTFKQLLAAYRTDGTSHFFVVQTKQRNQQYVVGTNPAGVPIVASGSAGTASTTSPTLVSVSLANLIPPIANCASFDFSSVWKGGGPALVEVASNVNYGGTNNGPQGSGGQMYIWANSTNLSSSHRAVVEGAAVAWASSNAGGAIGMLGWENNL